MLNKKHLGKFLTVFGPLIGLVFVYCLFIGFAPKEFHSLYNTKTILTQTVIVAIGALGMTIIIISAGIDLSAGSLIALATVGTALILRAGGENPMWTTLVESEFEPGVMEAQMGLMLPFLAVLAGIAVCAIAGMLNGLMVSYMKIVPFIVTLGMMQIARGVAKGLAGSRTVIAPDNWINSLMEIEPVPDKMLSIAPGVWLMLFLLVLVWGILKYTAFGRYVYAIGSNEATARLCGIKVNFHRVWIYVIGGALTGVAGVMQFSNLTLGDPTAAVGMELDIIAAVVIGGGSLSGGEGSAVGSVIGALIMAILRNGCNLIGIPNYVQNIVIGVIIISAVGLDRLRH